MRRTGPVNPSGWGGPVPGGGVRFVIAALGRCGTNGLMKALQNHPQVVCMGEVTKVPDPEAWRIHVEGVETYLQDRVWSHLSDPNIGAAGFKWFNYADYRGRDLMMGERSIRAILMHRRNLIARMVSMQRAFATGHWFDGQGEKRGGVDAMLSLDPDWLKKAIQVDQRRFDEIEEGFADHSVVRVAYEDLYGPEGERHWHAVLDLLGVERTPWRPPSLKMERGTLRERLLNFDQLTEAFAGSGDAWMLDA